MEKKETVKSQLGLEVETAEYKKPYCLIIKNLTDEKLFDVKLFDNDHENQKKVGYSIPFDGVEYQMLLNQINSRSSFTDAINIGLIRMVAFGDYAKFVQKQLNSHIQVIHTDSCGRILTDPVQIKIDMYQQQSTIAEAIYPIGLYNQTQIKLPYLMPEVEVHIYLFPSIPKQAPIINSKK